MLTYAAPTHTSHPHACLAVPSYCRSDYGDCIDSGCVCTCVEDVDCGSGTGFDCFCGTGAGFNCVNSGGCGEKPYSVAGLYRYRCHADGIPSREQAQGEITIASTNVRRSIEIWHACLRSLVGSPFLVSFFTPLPHAPATADLTGETRSAFQGSFRTHIF